MRLRTLLYLPTLALSAVGLNAATMPTTNTLWYDRPAGHLNDAELPKGEVKLNDKGRPEVLAENEALPLGNGRIGAMFRGGIDQEWIHLNEISLWSGGENSSGIYRDPADGTEGSDKFGAYQPFGDLVIDFHHVGESSDYTRSLNLEDAVARVSYKNNGVTYSREIFASIPAQVIVMTCKADKPGALSATFSLKSQHGAKIVATSNTLALINTLKNGMDYAGGVTIVPEGGTLKPKGDTLELKGANACTIYIAMATDYAMDFKKNWKGPKPGPIVDRQLRQAKQKGSQALKAEHIAAYKNFFDRVSLDLGTTASLTSSLPTNKRLEAYRTAKNDPELEETLFQYGRYLIISSSRPNSLPANLQGLWNTQVGPAWCSDYHSNINFQMNYWGADVTNLPECHKSMINFFSAMAEPCRIATKKEFKNIDGSPVVGWTVRTSQNPRGGNAWAWNIPGSAWYAAHMWNHYAFTQDRNYLKNQAYPMLKEISQFWEGHLKPLGKDGEGFLTDGKTPSAEDMESLKGLPAGTLVAPDGWSPEHGPREDGVMHDQQLIRELFTNTIAAANILGVDREWTKKLAAKRDKLAPNKIGKEGNLQEWMIDRIPKTDHRHTSHLYAVYPGSDISIAKTPELAEAARKSLEWRGTSGDSVREWAWCWRTGLWARFYEGDRAHEMIEGLLAQSTLPNLLGNHPPMQMDGSFGISGTMAEMFLQSHADEITLLPALPKAWPKGNIKGLKARGNLTVDIEWEDGKVTNYKLHSPKPNPQPVKVRVNGELTTHTPEFVAPHTPTPSR